MLYTGLNYDLGYPMHGQITDWCEVDLITCCKSRTENITCLSFDSSQELLWTGYDTGRIQSHQPPSLNLHSAFFAQNTGIRAIQALPNGIITLADGFRFHTKGGVLKYQSDYPSLYDLSCMTYYTPNNLVTFSGGPRSIVCNFDLTTGTVVEEREFEQSLINSQPATITHMKRSPRKICCGLSNGMINVHDSRSLEIICSYQSHQHGIFDLDIKNEIIASCGPSFLYDQMVGDPQIKIFDLRMNQLLNPIQIKPGAFMLKFHPKLSGTLIVLSQGFFQFCDMQVNNLTIPRCFQVSYNFFLFKNRKT